jgi:hypothetical protein
MSTMSYPSQNKTICRIVFLCFFSVTCFMHLTGQVKVEMTQPQLMLVNDTLIIRYGFIGSKPWDVFNVRLEVTDSAGRTVPARSFTGDIGDSIYGGQQKIILWNLAADNIFISQNLYVEVVSEKLDAIPLPMEQPVLNDSLSAQMAEYSAAKKNDGSVVAEKEETSVKTEPYRKNNFLLSAIIPGWGLTRLSDGKPYWLIGVAGFGCIASSVYLNRRAASSYDSYKNSYDVTEYTDYFNKAEQQYLISNLCAYSAIAIWVIDLGIVALRSQKIRKSMPARNLSRLSVGSGYHGSTNTSFVTLNYRF